MQVIDRITIQVIEHQNNILQARFLNSIVLNIFFRGTVCRHQDITLYTYLKLDASNPCLYGFKRESEKNLFSALLLVAGLGFKTAFLIMEQKQEEIIEAVLNGDEIFFEKIRGVGPSLISKMLSEKKFIKAMQSLTE